MESIELLADRCLLPGFTGTEPPDWVRRRAAAGIGGFCLFARNIVSPEQVEHLCSTLHAESPGLVIAIDEEGGDVTRLEASTGSSYPGNLALGVAGDAGLTRAVARSIGMDLARAGIDLNLAPVADVNSNPLNPIVGVRSFGSNASAAAEQTAAWVEGLQSAGVGACVKHFPGHGDTSVDSHLALPVVGEDPPAAALLPFRAAIAAGARAVMSGHVVVRSVDAAPATISAAVMTRMLRSELGFAGLAVTDGLEMQAITRELAIAEAAVRAIAAGCDLVCVGGGLADEATAISLRDALAAAVHAGSLSEERLVEAASHVSSFAAWRSRQPRQSEIPDREVGLVAARRALRIDGHVRVDDDALVIQLDPEPSIAAGYIPWGVSEPLAHRGVRLSTVILRDARAAVERHLAEAAGRTVVLTVRDLHRHPWQLAIADSVLSRRPDTVLVEMGLPACRPQAALSYVATSGAARVCAIAAAEAMRP